MSAPHGPSRGVQWGLEGVTVSAVRAWAPFVPVVSALLALAGLVAVGLAALGVDAIPDPAAIDELTPAQARACFEAERTARCARLLAIDRAILPDFRTYAAMRLPELPAPPRPQPEGRVRCATGEHTSAFTIDTTFTPTPGWTPPPDRMRELERDWAETQEQPWVLAARSGAITREAREARALAASDAHEATLRLGALGLLGTLAFFGALAAWLLPRRTELTIGLHGVRIDGRTVPLATLQRLRRVGSRLVLDTTGGTVRSPALLAPGVLDAAIEALARLPAPAPGDVPEAARLRSLLHVAAASDTRHTPLDNARRSDLQ